MYTVGRARREVVASATTSPTDASSFSTEPSFGGEYNQNVLLNSAVLHDNSAVLDHSQTSPSSPPSILPGTRPSVTGAAAASSAPTFAPFLDRVARATPTASRPPATSGGPESKTWAPTRPPDASWPGIDKRMENLLYDVKTLVNQLGALRKMSEAVDVARVDSRLDSLLAQVAGIVTNAKPSAARHLMDSLTSKMGTT